MPIKLDDFIPAESPGVLINPEINAGDFSYSDSDQAENEILEILQSVDDKSCDSRELEAKIHNWPTRYHFSVLRSNIIRSLDFIDKNSRILEIGAGCGAVTRYLGENFASVDAIEGSYRRACITHERCRDLDNVRVFCSPLQNIKFNKEYDVVLLIGVLEWAPLFFPGDNAEDACQSMLKHAGSARKENGLIVVAIENKLGLKYWSGCREDHSGGFFDSIHGYPRDKTPVTFSRKELIKLITSSGFVTPRFYYPFPDYKLANTVLQEVEAPEKYFLHNWLTEPFEDYFGNRHYNFHEGLAVRSLSNAGLLYEFANSFVAIASSDIDKNSDNSWIARRYSNFGRIPAFKAITELRYEDSNGKLKIYKKKLSKDSTAGGALKQNISNSEWIPGDLLQFEIFESLFKENPMDNLLNLLKKYHHNLLHEFSQGDNDAEGYPLLKENALDYVPFNIVNDKGNYLPIDLEWIADNRIPVDYMLFRVLFGLAKQQAPYLFRKITLADGDINAFFISIIQKFYPDYSQTRQLINRKKEEEFQSFVVGHPVKLPTSEDFVAASETPEQIRLNNMLNSFSWRITAPLRWLRKIIVQTKL